MRPGCGQQPWFWRPFSLGALFFLDGFVGLLVEELTGAIFFSAEAPILIGEA